MPKDRAAGDSVELRAFCHPDVKIKCVAVFDTVGALGIPGGLHWIGRRRFAFHDTQLSTCVENCFHAVAIDEKRSTFLATMWEQPFNLDGPIPKVEQVWFPGVHSDVGGGYSEDDLSRITLGWMMGKLRDLGVEFSEHTEPKDLNPRGLLHESRKLPFSLLSWLRPHDRPIATVPPNKRSKRGSAIVEYRPMGEFVHRSALDRWQASTKYRPINLEVVLPVIARGYLPVIDWDGSVMPEARVLSEFASALR
jgi:hypothetical protein